MGLVPFSEFINLWNIFIFDLDYTGVVLPFLSFDLIIIMSATPFPFEGYSTILVPSNSRMFQSSAIRLVYNADSVFILLFLLLGLSTYESVAGFLTYSSNREYFAWLRWLPKYLKSIFSSVTVLFYHCLKSIVSLRLLIVIETFSFF